MATDHDHPLAGRVLMACLLLLGVGALGGGGQFLLDPSGGIAGLSTDALDGSPFADYLIPGLVLFVVLGVYPLVVLWGLSVHRRWAWLASLSVGAALIIWIGVQGAIVGFGHWLQVAYLLLGVLVVALATLPSVRRAYGR